MIDRIGLILADIHLRDGVKFEDHEIDLEPIFRYALDLKPTMVALLGDTLDFSALWGCTKKSPDRIDFDSVRREIDEGNRLLSHIDKMFPKAERHYWIGNHEERLHQFVKKNPDFYNKNSRGIPSLKRDLKLVERGYKTHLQNDYFKFGKLFLSHGSYYSDRHSKQTIQAVGRNVAYGHVHDSQRHTIHSPVDSETRSSWSIPCLCKRDPEYCAGTPNRWVNGFGVVFVRPSGAFNLYIVDIVNGEFTAPNGKTYKSNKKNKIADWRKS